MGAQPNRDDDISDTGGWLMYEYVLKVFALCIFDVFIYIL